MRMNAVVIAVATMLAAGCGVAGAADIRIGEVKALRGEARIVRDGQDIPLAAGTDLFEKDIVVTGPSSAVGMTFVDASRISIGPNSRLDLEEYAYRIELWGDEIDQLSIIDPTSGEVISTQEELYLYPAKHFVMPEDRVQAAVDSIKAELEERLGVLRRRGPRGVFGGATAQSPRRLTS